MIKSQAELVSVLIPAASHSRAQRAAGCARDTMGTRSARRAVVPRQRKGVLGRISAVWRRCAMGTNRISCLGVWRTGARREAVRINRMGATDWHRPYRARPEGSAYASRDVS